jgi:transcriptional regulator with XRE-family HTH domain
MARADAGLTISELAKRAGVSRDTISNAERGQHSLQATTLHKVAQALGRAPSELLAEEERLAPKAPSSSLEPSLFNGLEDEQHETIYDLVIAAARRQVEQDRQAATRALESERPQTYFMRHENEVVPRLLEYSPDELAGSLIEMGSRCAEIEEAQAERHHSILAKAIAAGAERWAHIASDDDNGREGAFGVYLVAADVNNLLSVVMGDEKTWEHLSSQEKAEISTVMATLGRITEGYRERREEERATEQQKQMQRHMLRQWTREIQSA